jgi:hypothetical protein
VAVLAAASKTLPLLAPLRLQAKKYMTVCRARALDLAAEMIVIETATMIDVDPRSAARASRSTSPREWQPWALEKKHPTVVATTATVIEMIRA